MIKNSVIIAGKEWERVTKITAYKMFLNDPHVRLAVIPCNLSPEYTFCDGLTEVQEAIRRDEKGYLHRNRKILDSWLESYTWGHCDSVYGRYPAYYLCHDGAFENPRWPYPKGYSR